MAAEINADLVKNLRERTGAGIMDCKRALAETSGDFAKAIDYLRKKNLAGALKRAARTASDGQVGAYIHMGGKIGVLIELNSETDFVAKTPDFAELVRDVAMHVAAANPQYVDPTAVPVDEVDKQKEIFRAQVADAKKPANVVDQIVEGKLKKWYSEVCLTEQAFVKDTNRSVGDIVNEKSAKCGEKIAIRRFSRFQVGESVD
ncbi:MAG: translation elongation factor Ts [Deltaproteobacteria bacterium]|nr:translation elongation factor Ts [Deltaproteobacteria bacterium]